jgi:hypothetical protein
MNWAMTPSFKKRDGLCRASAKKALLSVGAVRAVYSVNLQFYYKGKLPDNASIKLSKKALKCQPDFCTPPPRAKRGAAVDKNAP